MRVLALLPSAFALGLLLGDLAPAPALPVSEPMASPPRAPMAAPERAPSPALLQPLVASTPTARAATRHTGIDERRAEADRAVR